MATDKKSNDQQEKMIEKALRISGFLFPKTIDEIKEYEVIYGTTDVILPPELEMPTFLDADQEIVSMINEKYCENFAMAAREGSNTISDEIKDKIIRDIQSIEKKDNGKK